MFTATATSFTSGDLPSPSTDPTHNPYPDPSINGPSVYLYGFLATLVFIFLVSICVAWKGYRTRRVLRTRIDEAIARGTLIPGYDPSNPNLSLFPATAPRYRWRDVPRPVMYEEWIGEKGVLEDIENGGVEGMWGIKPTALDALRSYDPIPPLNTTQSSHATSSINRLLDPLRRYCVGQPRQGVHANQLQGRPERRGENPSRRRDGGTDAIHRIEEEQMEKKRMEGGMGLLGVREVVASVFIAMPDRIHPAWGVRGAGSSNAGFSNAAVASESRPSSWQQQQKQAAVANGSRPTSLSTVTHAHAASNSMGAAAAMVSEERKELPNLVLGVVLLGLKEDTREAEEEEAEGGEGKGKEQVGTTPL